MLTVHVLVCKLSFVLPIISETMPFVAYVTVKASRGIEIGVVRCTIVANLRGIAAVCFRCNVNVIPPFDKNCQGVRGT